MKKIIFIASIAIAMLASCGEANKKDEQIDGYKITKHKTTGGAVAGVGDYVFFNLDTYDDKRELMDSSPRDDNRPMIQIQDPAARLGGKPNPAMSLLSILAVGDSVSLFIPKDSMPPQQSVMMDSEHLEYVIVATDIMSKEDFKAFQDKRKAEAQALAEKAKVEAPKIIAGIESTLKDYLAGKNVGEVKEADGGLKIVMLEDGDGPSANDGDRVAVKYAGYLENMSSFDDSYNRGTPYSFKLGQGSVIAGWDKGIVYLNKGAKAILDIPYEMAYGAAGRPPSIPAKSRLLFHVELEDIK